jgi:putative Mg2+ transporter-C (MgtC) family protein
MFDIQIESFTFVTEVFPDYGVKIGVALICGAILGYERERRDKPAGLRTIVLITVGATLYMIVSQLIPQVASGPVATTQSDPARVAAQVVSGIGFLGAGTIIQARGSVHGLTTAAVIWVAAAIGLSVGLGFPLLSLGFTIIVAVTLKITSWGRRHIARQGHLTELDLFVPNDALRIEHIRALLIELGADVREFAIASVDEETAELRTTFHVSANTASSVLAALGEIQGVRGKPV